MLLTNQEYNNFGVLCVGIFATLYELFIILKAYHDGE